MPDFLGLMKQATQLQAKMAEMQAELDQVTVDGTAGGGMVTVTMSAKGELKGVRIDEQLVKPGEKEIIEDLIVAAHADARRKAEALLAEKMKSLTGGLPLPPGLKLVCGFPRPAPGGGVGGGGVRECEAPPPPPRSPFRSSPPSPPKQGGKERSHARCRRSRDRTP